MDNIELNRIKALFTNYAEWLDRRLHGHGKRVDNSYNGFDTSPILAYIERVAHKWQDAKGKWHTIIDKVPCKKMKSTNELGFPSNLDSEERLPPDFLIIHPFIEELRKEKPKHYRVFELEYMELPVKYIGRGRCREQFKIAAKEGISERSYGRYKKYIHDEYFKREEIESLEAELLEPYEPDIVDLQLRAEFKKIA